jgi:hypothetical protein
LTFIGFDVHIGQVSSEALAEPKVLPICLTDRIAKPLMRYLMGNEMR